MTNTTKLTSLQIIDDNPSNPTSTFQVAHYTTAQIAAGVALQVEGNKVFDTDLGVEQIYANGTWQTISTAAAPTGEVIAQSLATDPVAGVDGEIWLNTTENAIKSTVDATVLYMNPKPRVLKQGQIVANTAIGGAIFSLLPSGTFSVSQDFLFTNSTNTSVDFVGSSDSESLVSVTINYNIDTTVDEVVSFILFIDGAEILSTRNNQTVINTAPNTLVQSVNITTIHTLLPNHKVEIYATTLSGANVILASTDYSVSVIGV